MVNPVMRVIDTSPCSFPHKPLRLALVGALALGLLSGCNWVKRVSVSSAGTQGNERSVRPSVSGDGRYVAFASFASNLVAGDTNGGWDVFVQDTMTGTTTRVSVNSAGQQAGGGSVDPSISADGRYVAFTGYESGLVAGDTNGAPDIFVHDRQTGATSRVSISSTGIQGNHYSTWPQISGNGRYVAFASFATTLTPSGGNGNEQIYLHDRQTGSTTLVSGTSAGLGANANANFARMSADGRYVGFSSYATNLVAGDTNQSQDAFVRDLQTGTTTRVSITNGGAQANGVSALASLSADGRYIVFESLATNLVAGDTNGKSDIFVRDTQTATTFRVSVNSDGTQGNDVSSAGSQSSSANGRYVAFRSHATNLVAGDTNGAPDIFVRDTQTAKTFRVSLDQLGAQSNGPFVQDYLVGGLSGDGRYVVFGSPATNLVPNDTNSSEDVFIRHVPIVAVTAVVPDHLPIGVTIPVTISGTGFLSGAAPWVAEAQTSNVVIVNENTITMNVTVPSNRTPGARNLGINLFGTGPGAFTGTAHTCTNCVTFQ